MILQKLRGFFTGTEVCRVLAGVRQGAACTTIWSSLGEQCDDEDDAKRLGYCRALKFTMKNLSSSEVEWEALGMVLGSSMWFLKITLTTVWSLVWQVRCVWAFKRFKGYCSTPVKCNGKLT